MRINLNPNHRGKYPRWFEQMLNEYIDEFGAEYSIRNEDLYRYFFNTEKLERIQKLFKDNDIDVEIYRIDDLPSAGIIIPDNHPTVVMYKLQYSEN